MHNLLPRSSRFYYPSKDACHRFYGHNISISQVWRGPICRYLNTAHAEKRSFFSKSEPLRFTEKSLKNTLRGLNSPIPLLVRSWWAEGWAGLAGGHCKGRGGPGAAECLAVEARSHAGLAGIHAGGQHEFGEPWRGLGSCRGPAGKAGSCMGVASTRVRGMLGGQESGRPCGGDWELYQVHSSCKGHDTLLPPSFKAGAAKVHWQWPGGCLKLWGEELLSHEYYKSPFVIIYWDIYPLVFYPVGTQSECSLHLHFTRPTTLRGKLGQGWPQEASQQTGVLNQAFPNHTPTLT